MIFPIRSDRRLEHTPWVNYALVAANVLIFLLTNSTDVQAANAPAPLERFYLNPESPALYQFFTYQFLHASWMHLLGNMIFLYVFGNSVEDRLGKVGYLAFYLAGGVIAGLGHCLMQTAPVLGASGSIAAVTGAYLALFPLSDITIVYFFIFIGTFEISSMWLILFQIVENLVLQMSSREPVAYLAHLTGYAYGFAIGMGLLAVRLLPREPYDLLTMFDQYRRRRKFSSLTRSGYQPWQSVPAPAPVATAPPTAREARLLDLRTRIQTALDSHDTAAAAGLYARLLDIDPDQALNQQAQLDLANQFMADGNHSRAARAYELFLKAYGSYVEREQVQLILGLIYARYLHLKPRATELLTAALPRLRDPAQRDLASQTLAELQA
jgi:membrane associated rhomboid family serine protease